MKKLVIACLLACATVFSTEAQIVSPQPSPSAKLEQRIGVTDFVLNYSRPGVKGRKIFGDHLPYGEIWRFGANSVTKLKVSDSVSIGGTWLPAGEYALYATPMAAGNWTVYVGKDAKVPAWDFKTADAAATISVKPETLPMNVETFTLDFSDITTKGANLTMMWEKTLLRIPVQVEVDRKVMASIKKTMDDIGPYWTAANYYLETDRDPKLALEWVEKVLAKNPQFWVYHTKAKIQKKLGDYKGAIATAEISLAKAKEAKDNAYIKMNEKLIAEAKAGK